MLHLQLDICALGKALRSGATTDAGSSPDGTRLQAPSAWPGQSGGSGGDGSGGGSGGAHTGADGAPGAALAKAPPCERTAEAVGGPPPPGCAPTARPDPFLLAAQGAVAAAAAAAGRASAAWRCASAAERVALLGRRWYTPVEYPLAAPGAHPLQAQAAPVATCEPSSGDPGSAAATTGDVADAFQKPPRLILRHDGTTVVAPDDQADARTVTAGCVAGVKRARGDGAHKGEGSSRAAPLCGLSSAGALAPLLHYPIAPPAAVARRCAGPQALQQGLHWHASADAVTRIPTAPRSRLSATFREPAPAPTPPREEARLAEVLSIARRGSLRARNAPVPGPGAGFACLAGLAPAKALPPSFAFELLPRMVPLSRADVGADLRAIASAAESLFGLMDEALPTATKRARLSGLL